MSSAVVTSEPPASPAPRPRRVVVESPAKVNLTLAVTGRRPDGYHDLVSLVAPVAWGDTVELELGRPGPDRLFAPGAPEGFPLDAGNLLLKAAAAWREVTGLVGAVRIRITKRVWPGSGLGGGSSNAAAVLIGLERLTGDTTPPEVLRGVAAGLGSDVPLFLAGGPAVMRGRGERIEVLPDAEAARLRGRRLILFRPEFGIPTPWAYARIAEDPARHHVPEARAEAALAAWRRGEATLESIVANTFEGVVFPRFLLLPELVDGLARRHGMKACLSGSGSACFALVPDGADPAAALAWLRGELGADSAAVLTRLA